MNRIVRFADPQDVVLADRCIRPLCFAAPGNEYYGLPMFEIDARRFLSERALQLGFQGTCTLMQYRDRHFVVFTRHQIAVIPGESLEHFQERMSLLFVLMDDGHHSTNLPIRGFLFAFDGNDGDDEDDFVIAIVEETMLTDFMHAQFFPVDKTHVGRVNDYALGAGFPSHRQQVLMEIDGLRIQPKCKSGIVTQRSGYSTGTLKYKSNGDAMDGFSGGAIFLVRLDLKQSAKTSFIMFIDGLVQRGGSGFLRYLGIERILDKIDERVFGGTDISPG